MLSNTHIKELIEGYTAYTLKNQQRIDDKKAEDVNRQAELELIRHEIETGSYITVSQLLDEFLASVDTQLDKASALYDQLLRVVAYAHLKVVHKGDNG